MSDCDKTCAVIIVCYFLGGAIVLPVIARCVFSLFTYLDTFIENRVRTSDSDSDSDIDTLPKYDEIDLLTYSPPTYSEA